MTAQSSAAWRRRGCTPTSSAPRLLERVGTHEWEWTNFESIAQVARAFGVDSSHVSACCRRKQKQTCGFEFEYASPAEPEQLQGEEWRDVVLEDLTCDQAQESR
tara:strand:+ start:111 stop:422 length:312 start_codon:yes stop_codon:yes gene_type:complete